MSAIRIALLGLGLAASIAEHAEASDGPDDARLNQLQVIGTHNSYHVAPAPEVLGLVAATGRERAEALDYTHRPLAEQFSRLGIRQVELDVFADPAGGLFAKPLARSLLARAGKDPGPDPDAGGILGRPGFKVLHVQDVDYRSTAPTLADALGQVRAWSAAHPRHVPILVLIELKDEANAALRARPIPFTAALLDALEAEIRSTFPDGSMLAPDEVRGDSETLPAALKSRGWPTLGGSRGKVLFALDNEGPIRDLYLDGHPALRGRSMFVHVEPDHPAAAWMKVNDPIGGFERIGGLVRAGYLVRTRADADTVEARRDDPTRRDKALSSGAQFVSTDYPEPRREFSTYAVRLPGLVAARPNPLTGDTAQIGPDPEGSTVAGPEKPR